MTALLRALAVLFFAGGLLAFFLLFLTRPFAGFFSAVAGILLSVLLFLLSEHLARRRMSERKKVLPLSEPPSSLSK